MSDVVVELNGKPHKLTLPDALVDGRPFPLRLDGEELTGTWLRGPALLVLKDSRGLERHVRVRARGVIRYEGDADTQVQAELVTGAGLRYARAVVRPDIPGQDQRQRSAADQGQIVRSQITGKVLKVLIKAGDRVEAGSALLIVEAMKMENRVFSQAAGTVSAVAVKEGDAVQTGKELVRISP